jgi:hypothetical protein
MSRPLHGPGASDVTEQPIHELSALRDVEPPPALVARVMTQLADPRTPSMWQWMRRPFRIEIKISPLVIIVATLGLGALFVLIGVSMK